MLWRIFFFIFFLAIFFSEKQGIGVRIFSQNIYISQIGEFSPQIKLMLISKIQCHCEPAPTIMVPSPS
jgi:hypothetical protein